MGNEQSLYLITWLYVDKFNTYIYIYIKLMMIKLMKYTCWFDYMFII